jgi:23S rRNA (pseudouridine1915-N3)-methyltransferase
VRLRLLAVGERVPSWVSQGVDEYLKRLTGRLALEIIEIPPGNRSGGRPPARAMQEEAQRITQAAKGARCVLLDERGKSFRSRELAQKLSDWRADGRDLCLVIGGPDGFDPELRARAELCWSLSDLTLPHALVRVVVVEQIYRALSILDGHPYHRE